MVDDKKVKVESKNVLERVYVIPLRRKYSKTQEYRRAKKSITIIREFLERHMKSKDIIIDKSINEAVWSKGIKNPPSKVKVKVTKNDSGKVKAVLEV